MRLICNLSGSEYDCSSLFEGVDVSVTSLQACFAAVILLISVRTNLLLIVTMIVYHQLLDKASVLAISLLISNTLVSVLTNAEVILPALSQAFSCLVTGAVISFPPLQSLDCFHIVSLLEFCQWTDSGECSSLSRKQDFSCAFNSVMGGFHYHTDYCALVQECWL